MLLWQLYKRHRRIHTISSVSRSHGLRLTRYANFFDHAVDSTPQPLTLKTLSLYPQPEPLNLSTFSTMPSTQPRELREALNKKKVCFSVNFFRITAIMTGIMQSPPRSTG